MRDKRPEVEEILKRLDASGARCVVVGGLALILHGGNYFTLDVDLAFERSRSTERALVEAFRDASPRPVDFPPEVPFVWDEATLHNCTILTLETSLGGLDFLGEVAGVEDFEGLWERAETMDPFGHSVRVASIDDLIAMKRAAGRQKDELHLLELKALKELEEEGS